MLEVSSSTDSEQFSKQERRKIFKKVQSNADFRSSMLDSPSTENKGVVSENDGTFRLIEFVRRKSFTYGESRLKTIRLGDHIVLDEEKEMIIRFIREMKQRKLDGSPVSVTSDGIAALNASNRMSNFTIRSVSEKNYSQRRQTLL